MKTIQLFLVIFALTAMTSCGGGQRRADQQSAEKECTCTESGCSSQAKEQSERQRPDWLMNVMGIHTSELVLDFVGTYTGMLPCSNCSGVKTTVVLNVDRTFSMTRACNSGEGNLREFSGNYTIEFGEIVVLPLGEGREMFFDLREGSLALLDSEMNRIEDTPGEPSHQLMMIALE